MKEKPTMTRRRFIQQISAAGAAGSLCPSPAGTVAPNRSGRKRPNIIFVLSDTHRYNAMSFTSEFVDIHTPHMERMKREGVNFTNCYATYPLCSPYRAMMQTGKWGWETGHIDNHMNLAFRMDQTGTGSGRQRNATLGCLFSRAGYRAVHVGKWHQGLGGNALMAGYDASYIWNAERHEELRHQINGAPESCPDYDDMLGDGSGIRYSGVPETRRRPAFPTHPYKIKGETDQALGIMSLHDYGAQPLFMVLALQDPHSPFVYQRERMWPHGEWDRVEYAESKYSNGWQPGRPNHPPHTLDLYDRGVLQFYPYDTKREEHRETVWQYYASVTATDDELGRVMKAVDELPEEERDNTYVIYTSDHGGMNGMFGQENGEKMYPNRPSTHVPFLVWSPGLIKGRGRTCDAMLGGIDLFPTLCGLAGLEEELQRVDTPDARAGLAYLRSLDGVDHSRNIIDGHGPDPDSVLAYNLSNCFNGTPAQPIHRSVITREYLYSVQGHWRTGNKHRGFGEWNPNPGEWMLYDLQDDPYEINNRVADPSLTSVRAHLRGQLADWLEKSERPEWFERFIERSHYAGHWRDEQAERYNVQPFLLDELVPS